jgi:hypothetical protein
MLSTRILQRWISTTGNFALGVGAMVAVNRNPIHMEGANMTIAIGTDHAGFQLNSIEGKIFRPQRHKPRRWMQWH